MDTTYNNNHPIYRHTQFGVLPFILWTIVTAICVALGVMSHLAVFWVVSLITAILALGMSSLTTLVSQDEVQLYFGPMLFRRRIAISEIASAEVAKSSPGEGWGVRVTGEGFLFNITGDEAVRIHLRSGKKMRIGTDDAAGLSAAIGAGVADQRAL